ncbi:MAG: MFS transporter [Alphaproteobacteria bacterium]|nr:MFS transporter [Alphaproteobacteria bacterium]
MDTRTPPAAAFVTPVLIAGCVILIVNFSIRSSFGVFQIPIADEFGWLRAEFSMAIAIQNLAWGIGAPIFGAIAERFGDRRAIVFGALLYAIGLALSAVATTPGQHHILEVFVGFGIAGTGFGLILAIVGRAASDQHRSMALAIASAAGSVGQILGPPLAQALLAFVAWQTIFLIFAASILAMLVMLPLLKSPEGPARAEPEETLRAVLTRAFRDPSFTLIFIGFFSCGYQLGFITAHFPAFVTEMCGPIAPGGLLDNMGVSTTSALGAVAISVIGLANIGGTLLAGWAGNHFPKKYLLATIYTGRTLVSAAFILLPITPLTVITFSVAMGALWLATVPLTSGLVGYIYGMRYMGTLYGIVFFSHQLGSFMGIWLGGRLYDSTGDYTAVWWIGIAVGAFSALVHLPIRERKMPVAIAA